MSGDSDVSRLSWKGSTADMSNTEPQCRRFGSFQNRHRHPQPWDLDSAQKIALFSHRPGQARLALFLRIYLPSAMPMISTGLRIGLGQSWMAVVTAELIAAHSGLGYMIQANRLALETGLVLVGMCVIGLLGAAMSMLLEVFERHVLVPWKFP